MVRRNTVALALLLVLGGLLVFLGAQERQVQPVQPAGAGAAGAPRPDAAQPVARQEAVVDPLRGPQGDKLKQKSGLEFFAEYRLERDRMRSRQVETLQELVKDPNSTAESRQEAQREIIELTRLMGLEMQLENLIRAKGYQEAAALIQPSSVAVVVLAPAFGPADSTRIADLAARTTGVELEDIVIIPRSN